MSEEEVSVELDDDDDYCPELWLSDGETYIRDRDALCDAYGAVAITNYEGVTCLAIPGRGVVSLHKLMEPSGKGNLRPVS